MKILGLISFLCLLTSLITFCQNQDIEINKVESADHQTDISQVFNNDDPKVKRDRLAFKRQNLVNRIDQLSQDPENQEEVSRLQGMVRYLDKKIEQLDKVIMSEEYANKIGAPEKGNMSEEEYQQKKSEWAEEKSDSTPPMPIKTTLTRYEFEKLPKEKQEKILSMPERYTIIE